MAIADVLEREFTLKMKQKQEMLKKLDEILVPIALLKDVESEQKAIIQIIDEHIENMYEFKEFFVSLKYYINNNESYSRSKVTLAIMNVKMGISSEIAFLRKALKYVRESKYN